jgi:hypothetical protein
VRLSNSCNSTQSTARLHKTTPLLLLLLLVLLLLLLLCRQYQCLVHRLQLPRMM